MGDRIFDYGLILITVISLLGLVFVITTSTPKNHWQQAVIDRGYGLYCPNTGEFAFKGECENE